MNYEQAQDMLSHIVAQQLRWGKQYDASEFGLDKVVEALIALAQSEDSELGTLRAELAKANRQAGASKARETKLKKDKGALLEAKGSAVDSIIELKHQLEACTDDKEKLLERAEISERRLNEAYDTIKILQGSSSE
jgi:hypothetical protein